MDSTHFNFTRLVILIMIQLVHLFIPFMQIALHTIYVFTGITMLMTYIMLQIAIKQHP